MALTPVKLTKPFRQFNAGEVAGFDEETARFLVDRDMGIAQSYDAKTGKLADMALPPKPHPDAPKAGKKGAAAETPKPE